MTSPFLDAQGNTIPKENILGSGGTAVVIFQDGDAVKLPLRCPWSTAYDVQSSIDSIRREQSVYNRLQQSPDDDLRSRGVVRCIHQAPEATHLAYMANGDLKTHLATTRPSVELQLQWCLEMAQALDYVHERCVLVADIASRNFLLDAQLSLKLCDFSEASLLPLDSDMSIVDDNGYTTQIDIGLLGAVMYEIATGTQCKVELYKDNDPADGRAYWPARGALPDTTGIDPALGSIIEGCWSGRFPSAGHLSRALRALRLPAPSATTWLRDATTQHRPIVAIIGTLGHGEVVKLLLEKGAIVTAADSDGWTPLNAAAEQGHAEVVKLLLEKGGDVTAGTSNRWTPLHAAATQGHVEVVKLLYENGADVTAVTDTGVTPLHAAAQRGNVKVAMLLLEDGADDMATDRHGRTPPHLASQYGRLGVVKMMAAGVGS